MSDEDSIQETQVLKRLSMNTRISAAKIFDEESNDSVKSAESKTIGKMKSRKRDVKSSPYKNEKTTRKPKVEYEKDEQILERRQKQIDYGKNTSGYDNYVRLVPKNERTNDHPTTPVKYLKYSRRGWDGLIKTWRQKLHEYDPKEIGTKEIDKDERIKKELDEDERMKKEFEENDKTLIDFL